MKEKYVWLDRTLRLYLSVVYSEGGRGVDEGGGGEVGWLRPSSSHRPLR